MRTIEDVLDEMIGANYMITQSQIQEIREIHAAELQGGTISRRAAIDAINEVRRDWPLEAQEPIDDCENAIKEIPRAPERTGHWIPDDMIGIIKCDRCGNDAPINTATAEQYKSKYCPDCGAHMIEEVDE